MLTEAQLRAFHEDGYVRLHGVLKPELVDAMRNRMLQRLRKNGVLADDPATWPAYPSNLQSIRSGDPAPEASPAVTEALDAVFGEGLWTPPGHWGQALVTWPSPPPWTVPHKIWHLDHHYALPRDRILGVNLFLFVSDTVERQGGTVVIRGSPQLIDRFVGRVNLAGKKMKVLRNQFHASHDWLRDLARPTEGDRVARFMNRDTDVDGVPARVTELTGQAGDAVLCHPWLVHSGSANTTERPRLMRAARVYNRRMLAAMGRRTD